MKNIIITGIFIIILGTNIDAQNSEYQQVTKNRIYAEVYLIRHDFSNGFVSVNYERAIGKKQRSALRVGIYPDFQSTISFPFTYDWISNPAKNHQISEEQRMAYQRSINLFLSWPVLHSPSLSIGYTF